MEFSLERWNAALAPSLAENAADGRIAAWLRDAFPHPYTRADADKYIAFASGADEARALLRAIVVDGRAAGGVSLEKQGDVYCKSAELGYWLAPAYWGCGVMTEAASRLCNEGFARWDICRIFAEPFAENAASRRVLEKCGFVQEGLLRRSVWKNGRMHDSCLYGLIRGEETWR